MKQKNIILSLIFLAIPNVYCSNVQASVFMIKEGKIVKPSESNSTYDGQFKKVFLPAFHTCAAQLWHEEVRTKRDIWKQLVCTDGDGAFAGRKVHEKIAMRFRMQFNESLQQKFKDLFKKEYEKEFPNDANSSQIESLAKKHGNAAYSFNALFLLVTGRNAADSIALAQSKKKHSCCFRQVCDCEYE